MMRGATLVHEIWPNVPELNSTSGSQNCGWLKALKNSERNSRNEFSRGQRNANFLAKYRSKLFCPGPSNLPPPEIPNPRHKVHSALKRAGFAKQLTLIYPLRF